MASQQEVEVLDRLDSNIICETTGANEIINKINLSGKILSILHLNIRSVRKNFDELLVFLETFKLYFCDIIILSECWQIESFSQFSIPDYTTYYNEGSINKNDGVLLLIKSEINANVTTCNLNLTNISVSRINLVINNIQIGITPLYRPPSTIAQSFIDDLDDFISSHLDKNIEIVIGDTNIDISNLNDPLVNNYLETLALHGLQPYINSATRVTNDSSTCIDHIFVKKNLNINNLNYKSLIVTYDITDHYPIMINITQENINNPITPIVLNKTIKIDYNKLAELLKETNWSNVLNARESEVAMQNFMTQFLSFLDQSSTIRIVTQRQYKKLKPWISNGIIISIKKRDKMKKKLLRNYTVNKEDEYKAYRNNLKKIVNNAKNNYYKNKINENSNNIKKIYQIITEATNETNRNGNKNLQIHDNANKTFNSDKDMANFSVDYFSKIGMDMFNKIPQHDNGINTLFQLDRSMFLTPIGDNEIIKHINSLKNNGSPGPDGINTKILKIMHLYILAPLKHIINLTFKTGEVPSQFKISTIIPIYKCGNPKIISNYRPISLINNITKIFEKCLKERLINFLKNNNLLSPNQFGFTENLSTDDAIYELIKEVTDQLDNNKKCIAVFLDLAKAFDTVPHDKLLSVLEHCGVRGIVQKLFKNYLTNRLQCLRIRETLSDPKTIEIGVPQGTVLGPILFNIYISSLTKMDINGKVISYADDTVLIFSGTTWDEVRDKVKLGTHKVKVWLDTYKLTLNSKKTNYIAFSLTSANRPDYNNIKIDNISDPIKETISTKYLGIIIDKNLKWDVHATYLTKKIRCLIHKFYLLRQFLNQNLLLTLYLTLVESLIRYGIIGWGGLYKNSLKKLAVAQNTILKIIYKKNRLYSTQLLYSEKICNVRSLFILSTCCFMHKHTKVKHYITHDYNTRVRVNQHLIIPISRTNINKKFMNYLGPKFYNLLPLSVKLLNSPKQFSKVCKMYVVRNYDLFVHIMSN